MSRILRIPLLVALAAAVIAAACSSADQPQPSQPQPQPEPQQEQTAQQQRAARPIPPGKPTVPGFELAADALEEFRNAVWFDEPSYHFEMPENTSGRTEPIKLGVLKASTTEGVEAAYWIASDESPIEIDFLSGQVTYVGDALDYEFGGEVSADVFALPFTPILYLEIVWRAPIRQGSARVNAYEYRWRQEGGQWTNAVSRGTTSARIGPFSAIGLVEAQIRAVSDAGQSNWSGIGSVQVYNLVYELVDQVASVIEVTNVPEPPGLVQDLKLAIPDAGRQGVIIEYSPLVVSGGPLVTRYDYRYRTGEGEWIVASPIGSPPPTRVSLYGLDPETTYEVQVRAVNGDGEGEWSESVEFTTDEGTRSSAATEAAQDLPEYEPIIASNSEGHSSWGIWYRALQDRFSDGLRTDIRLIGRERRILLDATCHNDGSTGVGFWLYLLEHEANSPDRIDVTWRIDDGRVQARALSVQEIGTVPAVFVWAARNRSNSAFQNIVVGNPDDERLYVRIEYRGVQEDSFNLRTFRSSPVHDNLVRCGDY